MIFPMTLGGSQRLLTGFVAVVCVLSVLGMVWGPPSARIALIALPILLAMAWAMSPRAVEVAGDRLRILRRAWRAREVPLSEIVAVEDVPSAVGLRVFGVGGFFGSYGVFRLDGVGNCRMYATRSGRSVVVRLRHGMPIVTTPDDPEGLRRELSLRMA
jgi:hypothetical protein